MRTSRFSTLWLLFFCAAPLLSAGARPDARAAVRALDARYRRAATLEASFLEIFRDSNGGVASESGTVYFSRPGRMRREYESPEQKLFLVDGKNVWFYVPADQTASRAKLKESSRRLGLCFQTHLRTHFFLRSMGEKATSSQSPVQWLSKVEGYR